MVNDDDSQSVPICLRVISNVDLVAGLAYSQSHYDGHSYVFDMVVPICQFYTEEVFDVFFQFTLQNMMKTYQSIDC